MTRSEFFPLCAQHHLWEGAKDSYHRLGRQFWPYWNLDQTKLIAELQAKYASEFPEEAKRWRMAA